MDDEFHVHDPARAQAYLMSLPPDVRRKGQDCLRRGGVVDIIPEDPGTSYYCSVEDGVQHDVELRYDFGRGWAGFCSCRRKGACEHVFAALNALLAEHRAASVRGLSASEPASVARLAASKPRSTQSNELAAKLAVAHGRALTREETQFLRIVHQIYTRCRQDRQSVNYWDLQQMGFTFKDYSWQALHIWPAFPETEHEFWLYVAFAALEQGLRLPEFMAPVTDFNAIQERMARWKRAQHVEHWKQQLGAIESQAAVNTPVFAPADLRLVIAPENVELQWQRAGDAGFARLKQTHVRQLENGALKLAFTAEGELLWQLFFKAMSYYRTGQLDYEDEGAGELLNRVLRLPLLESRVVTLEGRPLLRPPEPLRWDLASAADAQDDYRLRLVKADGSPAPRFLAVLDGRPTLYLSPDSVFIGPKHLEDVLEPSGETRIPAPAIERASGVSFLKSLGLELPQRVRERVQILQYQVAATCGLRSFYGGSNEECTIEVLAEAPDGQRLSWTGYNWLELQAGAVRKPRRDEEPILVHDTALLGQIRGLLEPLNLKPGQGGGLALRVTKKFPELFTTWLKSLPPEVAVHLQGELASLTNAPIAGQVKLEVSEAEIDWFDLRVVLNVSDTTLTQEEIKLLLNARGSFVRLKGKGWRRLQYELSADEDERLARLGLSPRELSAEPQRLHALQLADEAARKFIPQEQVEQIQRRAAELKTRVTPQLPSGITAQLRPYQLEGFHFLAYLAANRFGGILADDMGLGKTLQTLAWLLWLRQQPGSEDRKDPANHRPGPALVVCPKSVMDNWHAEAARFAPELRVRAWPASELPQLVNELNTADLHVLNYSQLRLLGDTLALVRWLAVILDEGQYIKNPNSQTAQLARTLSAQHRLILSGTPIENRLLDLWSLMSFVMPGVLGNRAQFGRLYDAKGDPFARRRLAARVRPFVLRRTKAQVAKDLPDRIEEDLFCEIEGEQKTLYRAELKRAQNLLLSIKTQQELASQQFNFLTSLLRLRQVCCHPRLMKGDSEAPSAKTEALLEQLEPLMEEGQKVLVFSQFVEMLELLRPALEERQWPLFYLTGQTENRGELVRQFQSAQGPAIFLISLKAGGFGLNLTAASYVVLFDPWWNPAVENQAIDRTHRIGQTNKVIAYRLLIKDSIEEKIRELQKKKRALAEDVLGEEKFAQGLTLADFQFLFSD
jgi:hypothetical protein